jgi:hypothetical protein
MMPHWPFSLTLAALIPHSYSLSTLNERDKACTNQTWASCATIDWQMPASFCCDIDQKCVPLNSHTAAVCSTFGTAWEEFSPTSCDISSGNLILPGGRGFFLTTQTKTKLTACGTGCCPIGFFCSTDEQNNPSCIAGGDTPAGGEPRPSKAKTIGEAVGIAAGLGGAIVLLVWAGVSFWKIRRGGDLIKPWTDPQHTGRTEL